MSKKHELQERLMKQRDELAKGLREITGNNIKDDTLQRIRDSITNTLNLVDEIDRLCKEQP